MNPDQSINDLLNSDALPPELRGLVQMMANLICTQRAALTIAQRDAQGWKARSELAERMLNEVLVERLGDPPVHFPPLSEN